jgi:hypothetical protein
MLEIPRIPGMLLRLQKVAPEPATFFETMVGEVCERIENNYVRQVAL